MRPRLGDGGLHFVVGRWSQTEPDLSVCTGPGSPVFRVALPRAGAPFPRLFGLRPEHRDASFVRPLPGISVVVRKLGPRFVFDELAVTGCIIVPAEVFNRIVPGVTPAKCVLDLRRVGVDVEFGAAAPPPVGSLENGRREVAGRKRRRPKEAPLNQTTSSLSTWQFLPTQTVNDMSRHCHLYRTPDQSRFQSSSRQPHCKPASQRHC